MRKLFSFLGIIIILSGCSLFGPSNLSDGKMSTPKHFESLTEEMHEIWTGKLIELVPSLDLPEKYSAFFEIAANMNIPDAGNIDVKFSSSGSADISDSKEMLSESKMNLLANINSLDNARSPIPTGSISAEVLSKMVNQKMFFSIGDLKVDMTGLPLGNIQSLIDGYIGNWYGGSFDDLENILKSNGIPADFSQLKEGFDPQDILDIKGPLIKALSDMHFLKMNEPLETEEGLVRFNVELDKEASKSSVNTLVDLLAEITVNKANIPEDAKNEFKNDTSEMKSEFAKVIDDLSIKGTLGILQDNPEFFTFNGYIEFEGEKLNIDMKWLENQKMIKFFDDKNENNINMDYVNEKFSVKYNEIIVANGEISDKVIKMNLFDIIDYENPVATVDLIKNGTNISGKISIPEENISIEISKFIIDDYLFDIAGSVSEHSQKIADLSIKYVVEELKKVNITEPQDYKSFQDLASQIQIGIMSAMQDLESATNAALLQPDLSKIEGMEDVNFEDIDLSEFEDMDFNDIDMSDFEDMDFDEYMDELNIQ